MGTTVNFFESICVSKFRESFLDFSEIIIDDNHLSKPPSEIRKLFFEYFYGKPQQRVDVTTNDDSINMPLITFVETDTE